VFEYTRDTIAAFSNSGVSPEMVQVGNEVTLAYSGPMENCQATGRTSPNC
jgi:arabinogalactan endo-1,4-beta-galactosidase